MLCRDAGLGCFRRGEQRDDRDRLNTVRAVPGGSRLRLVSRRPVWRDEDAMPQSTIAIEALSWDTYCPGSPATGGACPSVGSTTLRAAK